MLTKKDILELISGKGVHFQIHNHKALFTVEDSENFRGEIGGSHTKNLFLKNKKNNFFLFTVSENTKVDLKKFSKSIEAKNLSFANENYLDKYLGIKPGSVSPYALLNDTDNIVNFYLDEVLYESETVNFHPLVNTMTISVKTNDFINFMIENKKKINIFSLKSYSVVKTL